MADKNTYDTIIIGAGIGGLTTGNFLAKNGQRVLILVGQWGRGLTI